LAGFARKNTPTSGPYHGKSQRTNENCRIDPVIIMKLRMYREGQRISAPLWRDLPRIDGLMSLRRKTPLETEFTEPHQCSIDLRLEILANLPFFAGLTQAELEQANRLFHEKGFQPEEAIYYAGDPAGRLYVVAEGRVKLMRHTLAGKDVLLDILRSGEFFGDLSASDGNVYPETAQPMTPACILVIEAEDFRRILDHHPSVALKVLDIMSARLQAAYEQVRQLNTFSAEQRIAYVLLLLSDKLGEQSEVGWLIQAPLGRHDLAALTGTTTETTSRVISRFTKEGLIHTGRGWIAVVNRPGLAAIAEETID
jgi:CRP-like cAMP-binding protein